MTVTKIEDPVAQDRIATLAEQIGDVGKGANGSEMLMALCLAISAGIMLGVERRLWHMALADVTYSIAQNLGSESIREFKPVEH